MITISAQKLSEIVGGELRGDAHATVFAGVETDSRLVQPGYLFVAKPGETTDGHLFVSDAVDKGATLALVERFVNETVPQVLVSNVVEALGKLAAFVVQQVRKHNQLTVIGVTGSNGKTSTKNMLRAALSPFGETVAPRKSFNNEVGAPLSMLLCTFETKFLIVEMGADGHGSIDYLARMCEPDIAVELKVGMAHAGQWGGIENTAKIKAELVKNLKSDGVLIFNADDSYCAAMATDFNGRTFGFGTSQTDYHFAAVEQTIQGTSAEFTYPDGERARLSLKILGDHQVYNAAATIAVADVLGLDREIVRQQLEDLALAERWRMQMVEKGGITFINDAYNASPDSTKAALQSLAHLGRQSGRRTIAVLGEMAELGEYSASEHDSIGRLAVRLNIGQVFVVGSGAKLIHMGATQEGSWDGESKFFASISEAEANLRGMLRAGDIVLFKSSNSAGLRHLGDVLMGETV